MFPKNIELYLLILIIGYNLIIHSVKQNFNNILVLLLSSITLFLVTKDINKTLLFSLLCYVIYKFSHNNYMEGYKNKDPTIKKKTKSKTKKQVKSKTKTEKVKPEEKESYIDVGTNFIKAYENLTPNQIEGMTKDTQNLIGTQKKLMSTLNNLGPTLKEGKKILDTFKNYFDDGELKLA